MSENEAEVRGMQRAHVMDGVAVDVPFEWLKRELNAPARGNTIAEMDVATKLKEMKTKQLGNRSRVRVDRVDRPESGRHPLQTAAVDVPRALDERAVLLDSGSQLPVRHGRRDVHRLSSGNQQAPARVRHAFSLVLKGHIQTARTVFPSPRSLRVTCSTRTRAGLSGKSR